MAMRRQEDIKIFACNPRSDQEWCQITVKDTEDLDSIVMANLVSLHKLFHLGLREHYIHIDQLILRPETFSITHCFIQSHSVVSTTSDNQLIRFVT
jgi:hypothetical protein